MLQCNETHSCSVLRDLVLFVEFKKREKHPWRMFCNFTKIKTPPWVFFMFFKLYKWYQIAQRTIVFHKSYYFFNPNCPGGEWAHCAHPLCRFFDCCILTGRALKLILCDFSSYFILNMWPVKFFWSVERFAHTGLLVGDRQRLSLIMELSSHFYTALVFETRCKFGYLIATYNPGHNILALFNNLADVLIPTSKKILDI